MNKICFIGNPNWPHVMKWATWITSLDNFELHIVSNTQPTYGCTFWYPICVDTYSFLPWSICSFLAIRKLFAGLSPDLVHIHNLEYSMVPAGFAWNGPLVLTTYGLDVTRFNDPHSSWRARFAKRRLLRRADVVTSASQFLAEATRKVASLETSKVVVTPFGVDTDQFSPRRKPKDCDVVVIGMVKDFKPEYAPLDYVRAIQLLLLRGRNVRAFLQGKGPLDAEIRALVRELDLESVIEVRSAVPLDQMPDVYSEMDICVMPSLQESFGVVALEAQSMEVPVVATPVEGLKEVILDGVSGLHVPPGNPQALADALDRLVCDPALRRSMGAAGRNFVLEHFDWRISVKIMEDIYDRLLSNKGRR